MLTGRSTGAGRVGDGLEDRGVLASPKLTDNSQATGTVVVKICVDENGKVTRANYTQRGSNTSNSRLTQLAEANARTYRFNPSSTEMQCGSITYVFVAQ